MNGKPATQVGAGGRVVSIALFDQRGFGVYLTSRWGNNVDGGTVRREIDTVVRQGL